MNMVKSLLVDKSTKCYIGGYLNNNVCYLLCTFLPAGMMVMVLYTFERTRKAVDHEPIHIQRQCEDEHHPLWNITEMYFRGRSSPLSNMFMFPFRWSGPLFEPLTRLPVREGSGGRRRRRSFGGRLVSGEADRGPVPAQGDDQQLVDRGEDEADAGHARDQALSVRWLQGLIDLHSTFVEDTSDAFCGRGRDGHGLISLGLHHSLVRDGRRRVLIAGSSQTRSMGAAYHDANPSTPSLVDVVSISGARRVTCCGICDGRHSIAYTLHWYGIRLSWSWSWIRVWHYIYG